MTLGRRRLTLIGILSLLLGLLILFPARVAYHWFAPDGLTLAGIKGTIWSGSAADGMIDGIYARDLAWQLKASRLFQGRLAYVIDALPIGGFVDGEVAIGVNGRLAVYDLRASLPLSFFASSLGVHGLAGTANVQFGKLTVSGGLPADAHGTIDVADLLVPMLAARPIGSFRAEFLTDENGAIVASVQDTAAVIDLAGRLQLTADRTYEFLGQIAATARTPDSVRQQLQYLGTPDDRGQYELRLEGQL